MAVVSHVTFEAFLLGYDGISESAIAVFIRDKTHYVHMLQAMRKHFNEKLKKGLKENLARSLTTRGSLFSNIISKQES